ncbi:MAG: nucleoside 2-deoxyribosyltransferase [Chloroflexi bacterium]|nr:nucleoside 2-deoxyribosyltransferase [Chloroflexota bacterium]
MSKGNIIYVVTRLFDFAEKLKTESLEQAVLKGLLAARNASIQQAGTLSTFVPFRDTAQNILRGPDVARVIYEADLIRLESLFAIVGYFDGVSKDEGICMEVGYAYAFSKPILFIVTDFLAYKLKQKPSIQFYYDPILERMTGHLIYNSTLPEADSFEQRLLAAISSIHDQVSHTVFDLIAHPTKYTSSLPAQFAKPSHHPLVLLEFGGGLFEWQKLLASQLYDILRQKTKCEVAITHRYLGDSTSSYEAGEKDIILALMADILIICTDSEEMNAGSAALVGLGKALNKPVILYDSKATISFVEGAQEMSRNLMIDCSATEIVSRLESIPGIVASLLSQI